MHNVRNIYSTFFLRLYTYQRICTQICEVDFLSMGALKTKRKRKKMQAYMKILHTFFYFLMQLPNLLIPLLYLTIRF